jgi:hypothetical protein
MKNHPIRLAMVGLILPILIWLAWPNGSDESNGQEMASPQPESERGRVNLGFAESGISNSHDKVQRKTPNRVNSTDEQGMRRLDSLILNQTLEHREVAVQLRMIASDKRNSKEIRSEALGHGVLLDLPVFANMAADTQLPVDMAQDLLMHVINHNQDPALQIRAYKDFLTHPSSEIREEARQRLAFILEDDFDEADGATLLKMADEKLKQLEAEANSKN